MICWLVDFGLSCILYNKYLEEWETDSRKVRSLAMHIGGRLIQIKPGLRNMKTQMIIPSILRNIIFKPLPKNSSKRSNNCRT